MSASKQAVTGSVTRVRLVLLALVAVMLGGRSLFAACPFYLLHPNFEPMVPVLAKGSRELTGTLRLVPDGPPTVERSARVVVLLDRSGSMYDGEGERIKSAVNSLARALDVFPKQSKVTVLGFGDSTVPITESLSPVETAPHLTMKNPRLADGLGTTRLDDALSQALRLFPSSPDGEKNTADALFIITDGEVSCSEQSCLDLARRAERGITISTVAVGTDTKEEFLRSLAGEPPDTNGTYHFVGHEDSVRVFSEALKSLTNPALKNVKVEIQAIGGNTVFQADPVLPRVVTRPFRSVNHESVSLGTVPFATTALQLGFNVAPKDSGRHPVAKVIVTWTNPDGKPGSREYTLQADYGTGGNARNLVPNKVPQIMKKLALLQRAVTAVNNDMATGKSTSGSSSVAGGLQISPRDAASRIEVVLSQPGDFGPRLQQEWTTLLAEMKRDLGSSGSFSPTTFRRLKELSEHPGSFYGKRSP